MEIDLALHEAAMKARAKHNAMRDTQKAAQQPLHSHRSSHSHGHSHGQSHGHSHNKFAVDSVRLQMPVQNLTGAQVALPVSQAGSLTSRMLRDRGVQFKNQESEAW